MNPDSTFDDVYPDSIFDLNVNPDSTFEDDVNPDSNFDLDADLCSTFEHVNRNSTIPLRSDWYGTGTVQISLIEIDGSEQYGTVGRYRRFGAFYL